MRTRVTFAVIALGFALAIGPQPGRTQSDRTYVFTASDGHLVLRFAGKGDAALDASEANEFIDAEFSTMIHDRLHADLAFEDEPLDPEWDASMEPQIEKHLRQAGLQFSDVFVECRTDSCRVLMEQAGHWSVPEHQAVLETVQKSLDDFVAAHRQDFQPIFMITAYDKDFQTAHIKAFLRRTGYAPSGRPAGG